MMINQNIFLFTFAAFVLLACSKEEEEQQDQATQEAFLNVTFVMDPNANRLNNFGEPVAVPAGNAAQSPDFEILGLHYIGLYQDQFTPYENGVTVFSSPTTEEGGVAAIDFDQELLLTDTDNTLRVPLSNIAAGTYEYLRSSIGFQKYNIVYNLKGASGNPSWPTGLSDDIDVDGTLASFLGYNTYINEYALLNETVVVNANKTQGYFGLESSGVVAGQQISDITEGDAPQTTVPNPISATSPVPLGSCVVTGNFPVALIVPENPTEDIDIQVIISINNSFEWQDSNGNNKYEPLIGEQVIDMGTRGVFPSVL